MTSIVVLAKYSDVFETFHRSSEEFAQGIPKILVRDGNEIQDPPGWSVIQGPPSFSMAGNANAGWKAAKGDIFYSGDDVELLEPETIERLSAIAHAVPSIGILSPHVLGTIGNRLQADPKEPLVISKERLAFVCVFIKREVIDKVGYLDERFSGYGFDDSDFCRRVQLAGYKLAVTSEVKVKHEHASVTFKRNGVDTGAAMRVTAKIYDDKWKRHV